MHRNHKVAQVKIDSVTGNMNKVMKVMEESHLPPGGNLSQDDLRRWWQNRAVPSTQPVYELEKLKYTTPQQYLSANLGLSMSDHYWICPIDLSITWEKINFFENPIGADQNVYSASHYFNDVPSYSKLFPSAASPGDTPKKWIQGSDGNKYLVKGTVGRNIQQSLNEVFATEIHHCQNRFPYTKYQVISFDMDSSGNQRLCCISRAFTSSEIELIHAYDIINSKKKRNDVSWYEHYINICAENGLGESYVRSFLEYQILTDFLISNTDRHWKNFGVLRNSETLKFIDVAPIYDSGNSMFWNYPQIPPKEKLYEIKVNSFQQSELKLLKLVQHPNLIDLSKIPEKEFLENLYKKDQMEKARLHSLIETYEFKTKLLKDLQLGKKILPPGKKYITPKI